MEDVVNNTPQASVPKCERCGQMEELAEGFRLALIEAAKLIEFILDPNTSEAEREQVRQQAFGGLPEDASKPPAGCKIVEHGPAGDQNCPDCTG